jgi:hypothetical protein
MAKEQKGKQWSSTHYMYIQLRSPSLSNLIKFDIDSI